jgi:DNA polymerase I-like protein with 3'-5' exonuclease and polymerase domains
MSKLDVNWDDILFFDTETSTFNKGHPFDPRNKLVSYVTLSKQSSVSFAYFNDPDFKQRLSVLLDRASVLCGFNIKFDLHWLRRWLGYLPGVKVRIWDCQLAEFIISGQQNRFASLADTLESYGLAAKKKDLVAEYWQNGISTEDIPVEILKEYNIADVTPLPDLMKAQYELLTPKQRALVWLEGEDLKALADAEYNGVKFDVEGAGRKLESLRFDLTAINNSLDSYLPAGIPESSFNWDSGDHLSAFLYGGTIDFKYAIPTEAIYKSGPNKGETYTRNRWMVESVQFPERFKPIKNSEVAKTKTDPNASVRFYQTDAPTLKQLKTKTTDQRNILRLLEERSKKIKVQEMIESILAKMQTMNWQDDLIHSQFNQNVAITGRLSSSAPNLQNTPLEIDELLISRYS